MCRKRVPLAPLLAAACLACLAMAADEEIRDPRSLLNEAKAAAGSIPAQAQALARLAWGHDDPLVRSAARDELVKFGSYAFPALRKTVKEVDPLYRADVTAAMIAARMRDPSGSPPDYLPGLEEAIWFGSVEAQRLAMIELSRYPFPPAVLTIIDAIHQTPELTQTGLRALGRMRDERARHFLRRVVQHGEPGDQRLAAQALGLLGETGIAILREEAQSELRTAREASVVAYLPYVTPDDVTLLHEYVTRRGEDDPEVIAAVRERALELERMIEQLQPAASAEDTATPGSEP